MRAIADAGNYDLDAPIVCVVYGDRFTIDRRPCYGACAFRGHFMSMGQAAALSLRMGAEFDTASTDLLRGNMRAERNAPRRC
jgi:hypothetical protein